MAASPSRYRNAPALEHTDALGRTVRYTDNRFVARPPAEQSHVVQEGERTDLVAAERLRDPERYWRLCDANGTLWPEDLVAEPGRRIRVPAPEG